MLMHAHAFGGRGGKNHSSRQRSVLVVVVAQVYSGTIAMSTFAL